MRLARLLAMLGAIISISASAEDDRIVALSWESTEHLLKLGISPLGVADANDYRKWVVNPVLPDEVIDIGSRTEPNLELLVQLRPTTIVTSSMLGNIRGILERIAPVIEHDSFQRDADNYLLQRNSYLTLARYVGREAQALERLALMDTRINELRRQINDHFSGRPPRVAVIRFSSPTVVYINAQNSMIQRAMDLLNLSPAFAQPASDWGITQTSVTSLGAIRDGVVLHIEPFAQQEIIFGTVLWNAMPFVRANRFGHLPATWSYGGVFSVEYLAESIAEALLRIPLNDATTL